MCCTQVAEPDLSWFDEDGSVNQAALGQYIGNLKNKALQRSLLRLKKVVSLSKADQVEVQHCA